MKNGFKLVLPGDEIKSIHWEPPRIIVVSSL